MKLQLTPEEVELTLQLLRTAIHLSQRTASIEVFTDTIRVFDKLNEQFIKGGYDEELG